MWQKKLSIAVPSDVDYCGKFTTFLILSFMTIDKENGKKQLSV